MEHRYSERMFLAARVTVHSRLQRAFAANLRNISLGGAFVETGEIHLPANEPVVLALTLGETGTQTCHRLHAMVVRPEHDGAGIMFTDSDAAIVGALRGILVGAPAADPKPRFTSRPGVARTIWGARRTL